MNTDDTTFRAVPLAQLAVELGEDIDDLARELAADLFLDFVGMRAVTSMRARRLLEERYRRREQAAQDARDRAQDARQRRQAAQARALAARRDPESRIRRLEIVNAAPISGYADRGLPVEQMTAAADLSFEGQVATPRPSPIDWLSGAAEGGARFPVPARPKKR